MGGRAVLIALALCAAAPAGAQSVTAILEPAQYAEMKTTVSGRIETIYVREGDAVTGGQPIVQIDADVQRARVALARVAAEGQGGPERARTALAQAMSLRDRVATAHDKGAAHKWEVTQTDQAVALAEADLVIANELQARAEAQLALEQATLEEFVVLAPFDGRVLDVFTEPGETIELDTIILAVGHLDTLTATAFVPLDWAAGFTRGETVSVSLDTPPGAVADAVVAVVDPRLDPASRTVRIQLELANPDGAYLAGTAITLMQP